MTVLCCVYLVPDNSVEIVGCQANDTGSSDCGNAFDGDENTSWKCADTMPTLTDETTCVIQGFIDTGAYDSVKVNAISILLTTDGFIPKFVEIKFAVNLSISKVMRVSMDQPTLDRPFIFRFPPINVNQVSIRVLEYVNVTLIKV